MTWADSMLAIDLETTGVDPFTDRPVVVATALVAGGTLETTSWVINAGVPVPGGAAEIHGYTNERIQDEGVPPERVLPILRAQVETAIARGFVIVVFNARFDLTLLDIEAKRLGVSRVVSWRPVVDPGVIDKQIDRYRRGSRKLEALCDHYRVKLDQAHDATFDAVAAARLAWRLSTLEDIGDRDPGELHDLQVGWAAEQARGLRDYFRKIGNDDWVNVREEWPVVTEARQEFDDE